MSYENKSGGDEVEFNDAFNTIQRINYWEQEASKNLGSLLSRNPLTGAFGFEDCVTALNNIFFEISGDLTETELDELLELKTLLDLISFKKPFIDLQVVDNFGTTNKVGSINEDYFYSFKKKIDEYRLRLVRSKKKHGYGNPLKQSSSNAMMR